MGAAAPAAAGVHETDCSSAEMVKEPSVFLYAAAPLGGAIVACVDSFHCPAR